MNSKPLKERVIDKLKSGAPYVLHNCSMCGYPCAFFAQNDVLFYDSGCDCTTYNSATARDWSELEFYLDPANGHIENFEAWLTPVHAHASHGESKP